ncbi:hypothetical protein PUR29_14165 [Methylobacterium ajmalii]|uniref:Right handed beta helix domain-containing protein n=1 Tax=Methylobacterium ajmalii TaxID=2738439 RepID=A0ABU9ZT79_9HYPH
MTFRVRAAAALAAALFSTAALAGPDYSPSKRQQYPSPNLNRADADSLVLRGPNSAGEIPNMTVGGTPLSTLLANPAQIDGAGNVTLGPLVLGKRQAGKFTMTPDVVTGDGSAMGTVGAGPVARTLAARARDAVYLADYIPLAEQPAIAAGTSTYDVTQWIAKVMADGYAEAILTPGLYNVCGHIAPRSNFHLRGVDRATVTLKQCAGSNGAAMIEGPGGTVSGGAVTSGWLDNFTVSDLTVDVNWIDTGLRFRDARDLRIARVDFKRCQYWCLVVGSNPALDTTAAITSERIRIEDVTADGAALTYGQVLVYNARDVAVTRSIFKNGRSGAIGIEIWQNVYGFSCDHCTFGNLTIGAYYSESSRDIRFLNSTFVGNGGGLQGSQSSDHGNFGSLFAQNLIVDGSLFEGNDVAQSIGAINGAKISNTTYRANKNALKFYGGSVVGPKTLASNVTLSAVDFVNNNIENNLFGLHAAMIFTEMGGALNLTLRDVNFYDTRTGSETQQCAMAFFGGFNYANIQIFGGNLNTYNNCPTFNLQEGSTVSNVHVWGGMNRRTADTPAAVTVH